MPTISMFYGILVSMYFYDNEQHNKPHIHVQSAEFEASICIETGDVLSGNLPKTKLKLVQAWVEIHKENLMLNWNLAVNGGKIFKIDPLR